MDPHQRDNILIIMLIVGLFYFMTRFFWTTSQMKLAACQCDYTFVESGWPNYDNVVCHQLKTTEDIQCAIDFLHNIPRLDSTPMHMRIAISDLALLHHDFFMPYRITELRLYFCNLAEVPKHVFLRTVGHHLETLQLDNNVITSIAARDFQQCTRIRVLDLSYNKIKSISSVAFQELDSLQELYLQYNAIKTWENLDGLENVRILHLTGNQLNSIDKNAFMKMTKLESLDLSENLILNLKAGTFDAINPNIIRLALNPFNCDCTLKWLQDWILVNKSGQDATCFSPEIAPLEKLNFCHLSALEEILIIEPASEVKLNDLDHGLNSRQGFTKDLLQLAILFGMLLLLLYTCKNHRRAI